MEQTRLAMKVSAVSIAINILLSVFKLAAGIIGRSNAMVSDALHSASDVFSTFIVIIGVKLSGRKSDKEHPYGHERLECAASIILAGILFATGIGIGISGAEDILYRDYRAHELPGVLALIASVVSIGVKEWMYWYTRGSAVKLRSGALMADAWHHRSDALSSVAALTGILGARLGYPAMDAIAGAVISIFIVKAAAGIFKDALERMVDKSCGDEMIRKMSGVALEKQGVLGIDDIRTRIFGSRIYVDMEIAANEKLTLKEAHRIAEEVHDAIEDAFPEVKHCMVHVNPAAVKEV